MAQNRFYSSTAAKTQLTAGINATATTIPVAATTGFPVSFPYTLILERDTANEEVVTITGASGLNLTGIRGVDGTTAVTHSNNATVEHGVSARDFNEPQAHIAATANVHGLGSTSSVVGTTDTQTLSNKTLVAPTIGDFSNAVHGHGAASGGALLQVNTHGSPDTDTATTSLHHTLGTTANQAAAGNHGHTAYANTTHTHAESDVTSLTTDLAGKASTSHTHSGVYQPAGSYCTNVSAAGRVVSGQVSVGLSGGVGTVTISFSGFTGVPQVLAVCLGGSGSGYVSINNPTSTSADLVVQNSTGASRLVNYIVIGN